MLYPTLKAEMARRGLKTRDIAETLEVTTRTAYNKLTGKSKFMLNETVIVRDKHFPGWDIEVLFLREQKGA
ncbi:MAG TPA: hypothetical protein VMW91_10580 [Desulfosporosinus sp.]|nr:hypothetical protein [Desulfosporosinus sp.]